MYDVVEVGRGGAPQAKPFASLLAAVPGACVKGDGRVLVTDLTEDSRTVVPGSAFVCVRGAVYDGHAFVADVAARGAVAVVVEAGRARDLPPLPGVAVGVVPDTLAAMAPIAATFYDHPSAKLTLVGVTGTNGKTTTALMIETIFRAAGRTTGVVGTLEYRLGDRRLAAPHTTPKPLELQRLLAEMVAAGVTHVAMEVSSHALSLHRVDGCRFGAAVFTNLTQDHLDFHGNMEEYLEAKLRLFADPDYLPADGARLNVLNADDPAAPQFSAQARGHTLTYGLVSAAEAYAEDVVLTPQGTRFTAVLPRGPIGIAMQPVGRFNVSNALAALTVTTELGVPLEVAAAGMERLPPVRGRFERVASPVRDVFVDYAHTPDGLQKALESARQFTRGRLIVVFGCGGDRDRTKRPLMGELASRLADWCVITSDNPRTEDPQVIIAEILTGIPPERRATCLVEPDRARALRAAIEAANPEDLVLIAGKGHEDYQIIGREKIHFDDREVAEGILTEIEGRDG